MQSKDEVFEIFKSFKLSVEKKLEIQIKILRSDGGGEYTSNVFESFCKENGIKQEATTPYATQHNVLAQRIRNLQNL